MQDLPALTPMELQQELSGPNPPRLLDVREADELEVSRLPNVIHIPLQSLPTRIAELDPAEHYVVICRVGGRSGQATAFLLNHGFENVRNLATGMNGWARTVDASMAEY